MSKSPGQNPGEGCPADWAIELFLNRDGSRPQLIREASASVWASETLVAKIQSLSRLDQARNEVKVAEAASRFVPAAKPLGVETYPRFVVSWWEKVEVEGPASSVGAARWLRRLHDEADTMGLAGAPATRVFKPANETLLTRALGPLVEDGQKAAKLLETLPAVVIHGDANPTNLLQVGGETLGLDFGNGGVGPRVFDVACVAVLAVETKQASMEEIMVAYGNHEDVTREAVDLAAIVVAAQRAAACCIVPGWEAEGWDRVEAHSKGLWYVFKDGNHPK